MCWEVTSAVHEAEATTTHGGEPLHVGKGRALMRGLPLAPPKVFSVGPP